MTNPTFSQTLKKKKEKAKFKKFIDILKYLSLNISFFEALEQMPGYARFMKELAMKKKKNIFEDIDRLDH